jgi:LmbE family N-acetylglucosaminyl deacetylase
LEYKYLYLSPHLDDAVLSCGGLIRKQALAKEAVLVVTIFAGIPSYEHLSPFARGLHDAWGSPSDPVQVRRREDESALRFLGAKHLHLDYLDAIYRRDSSGHAWLYGSNEGIFGPLHQDDLPLIAELAEVSERFLLSSVGAQIYAPLALGGHVDHQIVRGVARVLMQKGNRVTFYEDYPYAEDPEAYSKALAFPEERAGPLLVDIAQVLEEKIRATGLYVSQMSVLFGSQEDMRSRVRAYALSIAPERGPCERYCVSML